LLGEGEIGLFMAGAGFLAVDYAGIRPQDFAPGLANSPA